VEKGGGRVLPDVDLCPLWLVCEDGTEYLDRFARFLGHEFRFERAGDAASLVAAAARGEARGVLMDLDFRRTPPELLVDESGRTSAALAPDERRRLAESQGILIVRELRARGHKLPVILFADLDDPGQVAYLAETFAPLAVTPSTESLTRLSQRLKTGI
jgi:hypothetical protein